MKPHHHLSGLICDNFAGGGGAAPLTKEEAEVMALYADGKDGTGVALVLGHTPGRVSHLRLSAIEKLHAQNLTHAAVLFDRIRRTQA